MPTIPFPNVPNSPGVPQVPRPPAGSSAFNANEASNAVLGALQGILWSVLQVQTQWGIYDSNGNALANPNSFINGLNSLTAKKILGSAETALGIGPTYSTNSVDYVKDTQVSDFPVEQGGFASYNKVERPATPSVTLCFDGSETEDATFLIAIDSACKSTNLYSVVTPEITYLNYTITRYDYTRRAQRGATLLIVNIALEEVRQVSVMYAQSNINDPANPAASPSVTSGNVQPATPDTSTLQSIANKASQWGTSAQSYFEGLLQ